MEHHDFCSQTLFDIHYKLKVKFHSNALISWGAILIHNMTTGGQTVRIMFINTTTSYRWIQMAACFGGNLY